MSAGAGPRPVMLRLLKNSISPQRGPNGPSSPSSVDTSKSTASTSRSSQPSSPTSRSGSNPSTLIPSTPPISSPNAAASSSGLHLGVLEPPITRATTPSSVSASTSGSIGGPAIPAPNSTANNPATSPSQAIAAASTASQPEPMITILFKRAWSWSKVASVLGVAILILFETSSWINRNENTEIAKKSLVLAQYTACQENESLRYIRCQLHSYSYVLRELPIASKSLDNAPSGTPKDLDGAREYLKAWTIRWFAAIDNTESMDFKLQAAINVIVKIDELYYPILETRKYHLHSMDAPDPHIVSYYYNRTRYYWERQPSIFFLLDDRNIHGEEVDNPHEPIQKRNASFLQDIFDFRSYPVHDPGFQLVVNSLFGLILRIGFPYHTGLFVSPAEVFLDLHILSHFIDARGPHTPLRRISIAIPTMYFAELGSQMLLSRDRSWDILLAVVMAVATYIVADTHNSFSWTVSHWMKFCAIVSN
ncbi:hypothetical protein K505DRAFT_333124 [Melanomma pulvis-pyrius CBS 109.77]|uniref:Uncharacterized protein n=1 Tax=Melanomma pulvis-pyrius CBS 109.77 TaxID=1314802 RepID=A0A6A6XRF6_9PLEO|nr:hypothetical protein K505DRAFT_333124 [Melanomma pulvis-pyrius CBS 109.77]